MLTRSAGALSKLRGHSGVRGLLSVQPGPGLRVIGISHGPQPSALVLTLRLGLRKPQGPAGGFHSAPSSATRGGKVTLCTRHGAPQPASRKRQEPVGGQRLAAAPPASFQVVNPPQWTALQAGAVRAGGQQ